MLITVSELILNSWRIYKENFRKLIPYMALLFVPPVALFLLGLLGSYLDAAWPESVLISNIILLALFVASVLFSLWAGVALILALGRLAKNEPLEGWQTVFNAVAPRLWPFIYSLIFAGGVIFVGTLFFIVPGIIFSVWYAFVAYIVILRNQQGLAALEASKKLVAGRWGAILWRLVAPSAVFVLLLSAAQFAALFLIGFVVRQALPGALVGGLVSSLLSAVTAPLVSLATVLLFHSAEATPVAPASATHPIQS